MPSGGHNKKPTRQKIIQGTFRNDRIPPFPPEAPKIITIPRAPSYMNKWAKKYWSDQIGDMVETGVIRTVDLGVFELLCEAYGQYREAREAIYTVAGPRGGKRKRTLAEYLRGRNSQTAPELTAMNKAFDNFQRLAKEFGMTPVSRNRIDVPPEKGEIKDPMERLCEEG